MGYISMLDEVRSYHKVKPIEVLKSPNEVFTGKPILSDAKEVALAEYDVNTKNAITAHHLRDYRRKSFRLALLPKIDVMFDELLKGSDYWNEKLRNESLLS